MSRSIYNVECESCEIIVVDTTPKGIQLRRYKIALHRNSRFITFRVQVRTATLIKCGSYQIDTGEVDKNTDLNIVRLTISDQGKSY